MDPHNRENLHSTTEFEDTPVSVTPVGTFAAGQSAHGAIPVVVGAEVGNFATAPADDGAEEDRA